MSVNQDSLTTSGLASSAEEASEREYAGVGQDTLTMLGAAIIGAILGMLLTILLLAILNDGTLRFVGGLSRLAQVEDTYSQLSANVGTNTANIETLNSNMNEQILVVEGMIEGQAAEIEGIHGDVAELDVSSGQFDTLVDALSGAISTIKGEPAAESAGAADAPAADAPGAGDTGADAAAEGGDADAADADADAGAADAEASDAGASTEAEAEGGEAVGEMAGEMTGDSALSILFFADADGNEALDAGEESLLGISVALINADGETVATLESTDGGMQFEGLAPGDYTLMVEDAGEYTLASNELGTVTVGENAEQAVYIAVGSE